MAEILGAAAAASGASVAKSLVDAKFAKDFQEDRQSHDRYMASHAYRMSMKDMQAAGLNPMLAYSQGGAHSSGSGGGPSPQGPDLVGAVSTAQQMKRMQEEIRTQKEQQLLMRTEGAKNVAQADHASQEARESQVRQAKLVEETSKVKQETDSATAKAYQDKADAARRSLVGPKNWYTDAMETGARMTQSIKKKLGLLNETPKRESERERRKPSNAPYGDNERVNP